MNKMTNRPQKCIWAVFLLMGLMVQPALAAVNKTLVLLPFALYADESKAYLRQGIQSMFQSRLTSAGLEVITGKSLESLLNDQDKVGVTTQTRAEELARHLKTDYAVFGSITILGSGYSLDLSILDLTQEPIKLTNVSQAVTEDQFIPKLSDIAYQFRAVIEGKEIEPQSMATNQDRDTSSEGGFFIASQEQAHTLKPTGSIPLSLDLMALDLGDIDQDGQLELLVLTRERLSIYSRKGDVLDLKSSLKSAMGESFLKLSVGDANQDGKPEVFLASLYGQSVRTTVFEWKDGLKKIAQMNGHLRILKGVDQQNNPIMIFQNSELYKLFSGKIYSMDYKQDKFVKGDEIKLPKETHFYTLGLIDLKHDNNPEFIGLGKGSQLYIWDRDGTVIWNSEESFDGTNNTLRLRQSATDKDELGQRFEFESPPVIMDIDRDGKKELLVIKNISLIDYLKDTRYYPTSQLVAYKIEDTVLVHAWNSREMQYCIMDLQVDGKTLYMAAEKVKYIKITNSGSGRIVWFE